MRRPPPRVLLALILAVYLVLGIATLVTRAPWQDEAWFGSPAYNLAYHGFLGTTILDPASSTWKSVNLHGIDRHTYWVMPLSLLLNAAGFRVLGFGSIQMRLPSLLFGAAFLLAWWIILRRLQAPYGVRALALLLIATDYHFQMQAADGRMDAMTLGLGYCGIAAYLSLRERSFLRAVLVSQTLAAAAVFTHPNGALIALLLVVTILYLDRKRLRLAVFPLAAAPYLAAGAAWAVYIAQSPADFRAQFLGNAADRGPTIFTPIVALKAEIVYRYMDSFGLAGWSTGLGRLNFAPLAILLAGVGVCFAIRGIRSHPGYRLLLIWTLISVFYFTWFEGLKTFLYLLYVTPLYSTLCAVAAAWLWTHRPRLRWPVAAALLVLVVLQVGRTAVIAARFPKEPYSQAVDYLKAHFDRRTFILGNGSLMFGLGPDWNLLDDFRLGYDSGKRPAVIVIDMSWDDRISELKSQHPEIWRYVQQTIASYRQVYAEGGYRILVKDPKAS